MSTSSTLRRSHPRLSLFQSLQTRNFSALPPPLLPPISQLNADTNTATGSFWRWLSGILTTSTLALALYAHSTAKFPSLSFADASVPPSQPPTIIPAVADRSHHHHHHHHHPPTPSKFLFGEAYRKQVFFNYEKRIRMRSPPEKVFEYFASFCTDDGEIFMTPADLMRAVVPVFPPSESHLVRDGYLRGERSPGELRCAPSEFFMLFDMDNDGLISFKEEIDREEFKKVIALMRAHNRQGAFHSHGIRAGHSVGGSVENGGLVEYFFGKDGHECLHHDKFIQFLRDLHDEMLRLEFSHYDYKGRGSISAKDFALSMVASADLKHSSKLLDRVDDLDTMPHMSDIRITLEEFKSFAELQKKLQPFSLALFSFGKVNGLLTKGDFKRAASQVCEVSLTDNVMEIIFHIFDANRDGNLSYGEFVRVLEKREKDIGEPTEAGIFSFLGCCWTWKCADKCGMSRLLY